MDKYFSALYEFICKEDNFEFAHEISERFEDVEKKLKNDFWKEVFNNCKLELDDSFRVKFDEDEESIELKKNSWQFALICRNWVYDDEIWLEVKIITKHKRRRKELEGAFLDEELTSKLGFEDLDEDDDFVSGIQLAENFNKLSSLKKILPSNRQELITLYSNKVLSKVKILDKEF